MPRTKTKVAGIRKDLIISPYVQRLLDELKETGDFTSESEIIRIAVINLYKDYEAKGKLKPKTAKTAEEIAEEIEQKKHKPVKETHAGEEEIR